jgi:hypothetical protein
MMTQKIRRREEVARWVTPETTTRAMVETIEILDLQERQDDIANGASPADVWDRACEEMCDVYKTLQTFVDDWAPLNVEDSDAVHWLAVSGKRMTLKYMDLQRKAYTKLGAFKNEGLN